MNVLDFIFATTTVGTVICYGIVLLHIRFRQPYSAWLWGMIAMVSLTVDGLSAVMLSAGIGSPGGIACGAFAMLTGIILGWKLWKKRPPRDKRKGKAGAKARALIEAMKRKMAALKPRPLLQPVPQNG